MSRREQFAGALLGVVFGLVLSWSLMSDPAVVQQALRFEDSYMFLFFASAFATSAIGVRVVRRVRSRAVITGTEIGWRPQRPERRHITGSLIFGLGWGISGACPGPIATQLGQGVGWGVFTMAGVLIGVWLFVRGPAFETEPAAESA